MPKFRKKSVVITAVRNDGKWPSIRDFLFTESSYEPVIFERPPVDRNEDGSLNVHALGGTVRCEVGDFLICGVKGEFYPCKPDIFAATYEPQPDHFPDITEMVQQVRETEQEPYGHCDSCGKPCDGSGVCSCGGPIAIIKTEPFSKASFSKAQENVCECGHTATLHRFGSANFICRVMSPCSKCECPDFRWNYVPPSDEEIEAQAEADFYAIQKEQRSIK